MSKWNIDEEQLTSMVSPINTGAHWLTVLVDMKRELIIVYDSLHGPTKAQKLYKMYKSEL